MYIQGRCLPAKILDIFLKCESASIVASYMESVLEGGFSEYCVDISIDDRIEELLTPSDNDGVSNNLWCKTQPSNWESDFCDNYPVHSLLTK